MKDELRLIIAFVLSILIIIFFGKFTSQKQPVKTQQQIIENTTNEEKTSENEKITETKLPSEIGKIEKKLSAYENNNFIIKINENGGFIDLIGLKKYHRDDEKYFPIIENNYLFLTFQQGKLEAIEKLWNIEEKENNITLWTNIDKLYIEKDITIPTNSHTFEVEIKIKNNSNEKQEVDDLIINLLSLNKNEIKKSQNYNRYLRTELLIGSNNNIIKRNITKVKGKETFENCNFIALQSEYALLLYRTEKPMDAFISNEENIFTAGFIVNKLPIEKNEEKILKFNFYAGPYDYFIASKEVKENIFGNGFFVLMGRFLFAALYNIHKIIPNWGWAIILLTLIIKIVFFPLTRNSLRSMKQIQKLRPYLQDLQKKYKNDPQKMQKEMFNLYREYKINPFGGCIPMLIQFPIFIGFFIALRNSIFLRGAPFMLWIKDLSVPDTILRVGHFPLNILPVLMTLTAFWQQKLTPSDPSQKALTIMMPLMFLFLFYNFSSGLLLYWVTMNIMGIVEQYLIRTK